MIEATKYKLVCDVEGCDKQLEGTPSQIAASGWGSALMYGGICQFYQFTACDCNTLFAFRIQPTVCPQCKAQGFFKRMVKE